MASDDVNRGHVPVLFAEVIEALDLKPGARIVDVTAGGGGHLARIAEAVGPTGLVIATDRDLRAHRDDAAGGVAKRFADRVRLFHRPFSELATLLREENIPPVDGLLADLGVSSFQLDEGARGFSFRADAPLDMRMDTSRGETAAELIARLEEEALADLIYAYGEEHKSRRVARAIKRALPTTTSALADLVARALGGKRGRIHPATKTFQALRIAVNGELDELDTLLSQLPNIVRPGGRAAIISFHSLEDRRVKTFFKAGGWQQVSKRPIVATDEEAERNARSRSAKLRVAICAPGEEPYRARNKYARRSDEDAPLVDDDAELEDRDDADEVDEHDDPQAPAEHDGEREDESP